MATLAPPDLWNRSQVSIHATLAGGDPVTLAEGQALYRVSIHATLAGGDDRLQNDDATTKCFYPRHPRGWRPPISVTPEKWYKVSIHATLAGGDTEPTRTQMHRPRVSIHATLAGGDSRHLSQRQVRLVSIHATLAGGDYSAFCHFVFFKVSIHATLAGGDRNGAGNSEAEEGFLSTPPSRVATAKVYKNVQCLLRKREKIICKIKNNLKHPPHIPIATSKKCTACPKMSDVIGAKLLGKVCLLPPRTGAATQAAHHPEQIRGGGQGAPRGFCSGCQAGKSAGCRFRGQSARPARL